ncbi:MAG: L-threonylcarbamoyladenylate synthase [bacterium]
MQIVLSEVNHKKILDKAIKVLASGGIVVYPSDTVYGVAVDGTNAEAITRLEDIKGRRSDQKFSYNFADLNMVKKYIELSENQEKILEKYLPGPFTFIISDDASVRIPKNTIITEITGAFGKPTTATSANLTGTNPATSIKNLHAKIYLKADLIIEHPSFKPRKPSTVVDIRTNEPRVIRAGELPFP